MDLLDYAEAQGRRNADFSLQTLELLSKRAHALLVLLLGGAGAAGGVALARLDMAGAALVVAGLGAVSLWWFALAAVLAFCALPTREVCAPAGVGWVLLEHARGPLADYAKQVAVEGGAAGVKGATDALTLLREIWRAMGLPITYGLPPRSCLMFALAMREIRLLSVRASPNFSSKPVRLPSLAMSI